MTAGPFESETPWPRAASDRAGLRDHQDARLRALASALETNRFYLAKLHDAGLTPSNLRTCDDLARVPFTTKQELVADQAVHPPFGRLLTYPRACYRYLHQTSGTSGRPLSWLDTDEDWATWMRCWHAVYRGAGVGPGDLVFGAFSFGPYISHWAAMAGARHAGALALAGGGLSTEPRLRAIVASQCTVLLSTPTYALRLAELAGREGIDLRGSAVRVTIHAGEPGASVPGVRTRIETAWGARCFDHAGATEVGAWAFACQSRRDGLHLNELEFVFDVIDPVSLAPVPDGTRGELVVTTLGRHGMPVLRYRTGDLVERVSELCACGLALSCIRGGVLGRTDDMLIGTRRERLPDGHRRPREGDSRDRRVRSRDPAPGAHGRSARETRDRGRRGVRGRRARPRRRRSIGTQHSRRNGRGASRQPAPVRAESATVQAGLR